MMLNWCYNEPWMTAANNSLISYPATPKPAYEYVKAAMRPTIFSARIGKFSWKAGETFEAEIWLLNDLPEDVKGKVRVTLTVGDETVELTEWNAAAAANGNLQGPTVRWILPNVDADCLTLTLSAEEGRSSTYRLQYRPLQKKVNKPKILNM